MSTTPGPSPCSAAAVALQALLISSALSSARFSAASKGEAAESETTPEQRKAALHLAGSLGAVVRAQDDRLYDAMILVGGDTALSICQALNVHRICLWDEVTPGMPAGIFGDGNAAGLPVVTKSGAFGDCKALSRAVEYIKKE